MSFIFVPFVKHRRAHVHPTAAVYTTAVLQDKRNLYFFDFTAKDFTPKPH